MITGRLLSLLLFALITASVVGCSTQQPDGDSRESAERSPSIDATGLWTDATKTTIGVRDDDYTWTNRVELADINDDGFVDVLFANGGNYESPGLPEFSQVFLNQGPGQMYKEVTRQVFGPKPMLARVIKVGDVNADGSPDISIGDLELGDVDGDRDLDAVLAEQFGAGRCCGRPEGLSEKAPQGPRRLTTRC